MAPGADAAETAAGHPVWYPPTVARTASNQEDGAISSKIFVGNLSYDTTSQELSDFLRDAGEIVDVFLPNDRETGRPRGFAFVEFSSDNEAQTAIERFDGSELGGRNLRINAADSRPRRFSGPPPQSDDAPSFRDTRGKPKGSRRRLRSRKRSL